MKYSDAGMNWRIVTLLTALLVMAIACTTEDTSTATPSPAPTATSILVAPTATSAPTSTTTPSPSPTTTSTVIPTVTTTPTSTATPAPTLADVIEDISPAVVSVGSGVELNQIRVRQIAQHLGSGFVYDPGGLILTNFHVIVDVEDIRVGVPRPFGGSPVIYEATVLGSDAETDLAVLRIQPLDGEVFPFIPLDPVGEVRVGDTVIALGYPPDEHLLPSLTATQGGVSSVRTEGRDIIQHQASVNPGNSGGPLVTSTGQITGINTFVVRSFGFTPVEGFNGAIGIEEVLSRIVRLESGELFEFPVFVTSEIYEYNIRLPFGWHVQQESDLGFHFVGAEEAEFVLTLIPTIPEGMTEREWIDNRIAELEEEIEVFEFLEGIEVLEVSGSLVAEVSGRKARNDQTLTVGHTLNVFNGGAIEVRLSSVENEFGAFFEAFELLNFMFPGSWIQHLSKRIENRIDSLQLNLNSVASAIRFDFESEGESGDTSYTRIVPPELFHRVVLVRLNFFQTDEVIGEIEIQREMMQLVLKDGTLVEALDIDELSFSIDENSFTGDSILFPTARSGTVELPRGEWVEADFAFQIPIGANIAEVRWTQDGVHIFAVE